MIHQITIRITQVNQLKVVCGQCERRAQIMWSELDVGHFYFCHLHVRCHGVDRLVVVDQFQIRVAEHRGTGEMAVLWEQLNDLATDYRCYADQLDADARRGSDYELSGHPEIAPAVRALERRARVARWFAERK